jgi:hypothetical protein
MAAAPSFRFLRIVEETCDAARNSVLTGRTSRVMQLAGQMQAA